MLGKEFNDPKVYRDLKIGFACLIILAVLVAFVVSPPLRHAIGIGNGQAIAPPSPHHHVHRNHHDHATKGKRHHQHPQRSEHKGIEDHAQHHSRHHTVKPPKGSEGVTTPQPTHHHSGGSGSTPESTPSTPPSTHPIENNRTPPSESSNPLKPPPVVKPPVEPPHITPPKVEVEPPNVELPKVDVTPQVEETTHGVGNTVNKVTHETPVNVPEIDLP